jgi:hypothetical protein
MKAKFTGHDTFPLRYGWLYKAAIYTSLSGSMQTSNEEQTREAIIDLGVGKNMVNAIRYWAEMSSIIDHGLTKNGMYLFGSKDSPGMDPYLELIGSIWLVHFWLNFKDNYLTAYTYFFNYSNVQYFEKSKLTVDCYDAAKNLVVNSTGNETTIKKDVDCFLSMYTTKFKNSSLKKTLTIDEDHFTSPLSELNLIQDNGGGFFISDLKERNNLPIEIFIYGLLEFVKFETQESKLNFVGFDSLLSKPCSPGRIFRLSEKGLGEKLDEAQLFTNMDISWIDSLGLRQIKVNLKLLEYQDTLLDQYYEQFKTSEKNQA